MGKPRQPPRCHDCNGLRARWVPVGYEHVWLCVNCEYERRHPAKASPVIVVPWERAPAPLQSERLF